MNIYKTESNGIPPLTQGLEKPSEFGVRDLMKFGKEGKWQKTGIGLQEGLVGVHLFRSVLDTCF